jgi:hypothetical protein
MTEPAIYTPTSASLSKLSSIQGDDRCVLTIYFSEPLTVGAEDELSVLPEACPKCGEKTYPQSAANEFTDLAFEGATQVELATNLLKEFNGVGALLRW